MTSPSLFQIARFIASDPQLLAVWWSGFIGGFVFTSVALTLMMVVAENTTKPLLALFIRLLNHRKARRERIK